MQANPQHDEVKLSKDFQLRAAKLADPSIDLKTKNMVAIELREMIDTFRDAEASRVVPYIIRPIIELLQSVEPSMRKDALEHQFRRALLEILHRIPRHDTMKTFVPATFSCCVHVLRNDCEDNGVSASKIIVDLMRQYLVFAEDLLKSLTDVYGTILKNMKALVLEVLSEDSEVIDPLVMFPSTRSFKVLGEMNLMMAMLIQAKKPIMMPGIQPIIPDAFELVAMESPAQRKAKDDFEAMGGNWSGIAPAMRNPVIFTDFLNAEVKMLSFLAFYMRMLPDKQDAYVQLLVVNALRILQDCPTGNIAIRKELMVVFRHLMNTPQRAALLPQVDKLLDERVLFGTGITSKETLRASVYTAISDFFHRQKADLTASQLTRIIHVHSQLLHDPSCGINMHILFAKVIFQLVDAIVAKDTPQGVSKALNVIFESSLDRLEALVLTYEDIMAAAEKIKNNQPPALDPIFIERARPYGGASYAIEKPEDVVHESRLLFRTLMHGFRVCLAGLKRQDAHSPDGNLIARMFEGCIRCMPFFENEGRITDQNDAIDWFNPILTEVNLHVFQEVWTQKMEFFFEVSQKRMGILSICQFLFSREATSPTLLAIVLNFLVNRLPALGEYDDLKAAATIRLFKLAFTSVAQFPQLNEPILASHLSKLLMDCFPLAAKASRPSHYFYLLRSLFRAIGGGGGRFELLYKEVLPLLPEMLHALNRHLQASEGVTRDMVVELCLTVPLRLTHLLPHLSYLMQPLALALRGTPELVSQGLRTLELCIDNLTPDFLDPTLSTVLRELMEALHGHLKPLPTNHIVAHTTIRILGKLGGRNRRLLDRPPTFEYRSHTSQPKFPIFFGIPQDSQPPKYAIELEQTGLLACRTLVKGTSNDMEHAFKYIQNSLAVMMNEGLTGRSSEELFTKMTEGLFDAIHIASMQERAEEYLRRLSKFIFAAEMRHRKDANTRSPNNPATAPFLEAWPHALARDTPERATKAIEIVTSYIVDIISFAQEENVLPQDYMWLLFQITNKFCSLCMEDLWIQKRAGCAGVRIMLSIPEIGPRWVKAREVDLVRTLLHVLKDTYPDLPRDIDEVVEILYDVIRTSNAELDFTAESTTNKIVGLAGGFYPELSNPNALVRSTARGCIQLLVDMSGLTVARLLQTHRERLLINIYTKPLRALPFPIQIGLIEAVRYCVSLDPPLIEFGDELLRLLHETLGLADADDGALIVRQNPRQSSIEVTKLRVACTQLLTASMPITDFYSKHPQMRQRITGVYFKSLYSESIEVKDVAHEGLRMVLRHQSRLPRELLQTGLRPILMNLADPNRLSVPGLEGLARLLELLTNYFKVEIGHKLLDHFRIVADPQMLQNSSKMPLAENEGITKLVRLANIFHLLPATANIFLETLVNSIVQTETYLHFSGRSPFSEPLAKYLDRYPRESVDFFLKHIHLRRHIRTLRSIIQVNLAPRLVQELSARTPAILSICVGDNHLARISALLLIQDMTDVTSGWISQHAHVLDVLVDIWRSEIVSAEDLAVGAPEAIERHKVLLSIFRVALQESPRIDILFEMVDIFGRNLEMDTTQTAYFLYKHVAMSTDAAFRRNILLRFLTWFQDPSYSWMQKTFFIRYAIVPVLLIQASRTDETNPLIGLDFVDGIHRHIWRKFADQDKIFADVDDNFKVEIVHLTTIMVQYYSSLVTNFQKDLMRFSHLLILPNEDAIVRQSAYLLTARFFAIFPAPSKFILRTWQGLLRFPHSEGRAALRQEGLAVVSTSLDNQVEGSEGYPPWALTARRLLAEEGLSQLMTIYQLIVKQPTLFYPVRGLFVLHMVNSLPKLGLTPSCSAESRMLSIDVLQVIFTWETRTSEEMTTTGDSTKVPGQWITPLTLRENMVSYLVRLATQPHEAHELSLRNTILAKVLTLLQTIVGPNGWPEVAFGLRYFSRALEGEFANDNALAVAIASAKLLRVICAEQKDSWYSSNALVLQQLIRKGLCSEHNEFHDALHPIFERLLRLYPLPKEDEEIQGEMADFHSWTITAINEGFRGSGSASPRGTLLMLKSVVQFTPERIDSFSAGLLKHFGKVIKDHSGSTPGSSGHDNGARLLIVILDTCQLGLAFLGDQRRHLQNCLLYLVVQSKNTQVCRYILDMARSWTLSRQDHPYPSTKDKASLLSQMVSYESKTDALCQSYLELIYEIYTDTSLRRSDFTSRLENAFLIGCRAKDPVLREKFIDLLDVSVPRSMFNRLTYIFGVQSWEPLADQNWLAIALYLILGATEVTGALPSEWSTSGLTGPSTPPSNSQTLIQPIQRLLFLSTDAAHEMWQSVFPAAWGCLSRREQTEVTNHMINFLSRDYHMKQAEVRPNVIQSLLNGIYPCTPTMILPPHLVKYLAKNFGAWHISLEILSSSLEYVKKDDSTVRNYVYDSLADVYADLGEEDVFYGLWRTRCLLPETNIAISLEQNGMWEQASIAYESAQSKARTGAIAFSDTEYCLWEDHWILSAEKLQHWDILYDLGKNDNNAELMLEAAWRIKDWGEDIEQYDQLIKKMPDLVTPRRRVFEAFVALSKAPGALDKNVDFTRFLEEAMQLTLHKWVSLPDQLSAAHVPLLQHFQQFVELQEAIQIFGSLSQTNEGNLEKKSSELKLVLQAWRERLPNHHDDISIWSDLLGWRQNVFQAINKTYIPLLGKSNGSASATTSNTYAYRGYHETAWIINRFAHVARKHHLLEACFTALTKIYTLPNIEISEAFLKLREQARCYYERPNELQAGLEVINNTNLAYFTQSQKAEFYTLKGMFHARFGRADEANTAFGQAVQLDISQAKTWAEWGRWNDQAYKENPHNLESAANAISCYLQAAGLYKNGKARPIQTRILWLLSIDDASSTISHAFDSYKGEASLWHWISLIPQLCSSLGHREVKQARYLLISIARQFPQALFYHLRTTREDILLLRRQMAAGRNGQQPPAEAPRTTASSDDAAAQERPTWEYVEEIVQMLKTAFPLLILSMETLVDQLVGRFKPSADEDMYKHIGILLSEASQSYLMRMNAPDDTGLMKTQTVDALVRVASLISGPTRKDYEADFITSKPLHTEYMTRLQRWRDRYEKILDARPRMQSLDNLSHYLTEFQYVKVDEIEIPGQYTEDKNNNANFVKLLKFSPKFENCRSFGTVWKRITMIGHDNSRVSFSVQLPGQRTTRREEKVMQVLRTFNGVLLRKKESRKRGLQFYVPASITCQPSFRLFESDSSFISLGDVYDAYCQKNNISREDPLLYSGEKVRHVLREFRQNFGRQPNKTEYLTLKKDIFDDVQSNMVPDTILNDYMIQTMKTPDDLWRMRKQFALQVSTVSFVTFIFALTSRNPGRFQLSRKTGQIVMTEMLPGSMNSPVPNFNALDVVPFRLTPNMQKFLGGVMTEGVVAPGLFALGRSLTEPEYKLEQQLCLFIRDEIDVYYAHRGTKYTLDLAYQKLHASCTDSIVKRAETVGCKIEREQAAQGIISSQPVMQTVINLVSSATNPIQLSKMGELYSPWF